MEAIPGPNGHITWTMSTIQPCVCLSAAYHISTSSLAYQQSKISSISDAKHLLYQNKVCRLYTTNTGPLFGGSVMAEVASFREQDVLDLA